MFEEDFLQVERELANYIAARKARDAEQAKLAQPLREAEQSLQSMQAKETSSNAACSPSDLDKASTADLLSFQNKLQAAEGKAKILLSQKQKNKKTCCTNLKSGKETIFEKQK